MNADVISSTNSLACSDYLIRGERQSATIVTLLSAIPI